MKILIIEDNIDTARTLKEILDQQFLTDLALNGEEGEYLARVNGYDLIILDLILPDINGIEVCRKIRDDGNLAPILILTGQDQLTTKIACLDKGADDYLIKPYDLGELLAKIRALLRRTNNFTYGNIQIGNLRLDLTRKNVYMGNENIFLRRKEFDLLEYFMRNEGKVLTRDMILNHVWDSAHDSVTNTVDVHVKYLRDKLNKYTAGKMIKTIHGFGYKIEV